MNTILYDNRNKNYYRSHRGAIIVQPAAAAAPRSPLVFISASNFGAFSPPQLLRTLTLSSSSSSLVVYNNSNNNGNNNGNSINDDNGSNSYKIPTTAATTPRPAVKLIDLIGNTRLQDVSHLIANKPNIKLYAKIEGENPASSVKDRAAKGMIMGALERGEITPGKTRLIEATSGNTGIAMAMICATLGIDITLVMPANSTAERYQTLLAFGAKVVLVENGTMEDCRDWTDAQVEATKNDEDRYVMLNQFGNFDNPRMHYRTTGPEIWRDTHGQITHFVSAMGTTGTIMGVSQFLKEKNERVRICGCQPTEGSKIPGIRRWPEAYLPKIFDKSRVDQILDISQAEAEATCRRLALSGLFCGISTGGACAGALRVAEEIDEGVIVFIACDRGDRYLSEKGLFPPDHNLRRVEKWKREQQ